ALSSSHIAFGSIRMEPVFMMLGQAGGLAAAMAHDQHANVQDLDGRALQKELKDNPLAGRSVPEDAADVVPYSFQ
ncbi:MAG: FAD-dependent oxidoreductase, partial [Salinibacter sp.]